MRSLLLSALVLGMVITARAAEPPLVLERTIKLPGVRGRIDHMAIDLGRRRLFAAERTGLLGSTAAIFALRQAEDRAT